MYAYPLTIREQELKYKENWREAESSMKHDRNREIWQRMEKQPEPLPVYFL